MTVDRVPYLPGSLHFTRGLRNWYPARREYQFVVESTGLRSGSAPMGGWCYAGQRRITWIPRLSRVDQPVGLSSWVRPNLSPSSLWFPSASRARLRLLHYCSATVTSDRAGDSQHSRQGPPSPGKHRGSSRRRSRARLTRKKTAARTYAGRSQRCDAQ